MLLPSYDHAPLTPTEQRNGSVYSIVGLPTEECSREFDLVEFMHAVIVAGPRPKTLPSGPAAVERSWLPNGEAIVDRPRGEIVARSRCLGCCAMDLPVMARATYTPRASWGRLKRFHSEVAGGVLLAESSLEYDVLRNIELDPDVTGMLEQPFRLRYWLDKWRTYTPDILVASSGRLDVIEVKYEEDAADPLLEQKWGAVGVTLAAMGLGFSVITERHVRGHPRKRNTETIYRCRHVHCAADVARSIADRLDAVGPMNARTVAAAFGLELNQVWGMVRRRDLAVDLDAGPLGGDTIVRRRVRPAPAIRNGGLAA